MTPTPKDLAALADSDNRAVLGTLGEADEPLSEDALATRILDRRADETDRRADETDRRGDDSTTQTDADREELCLELHHRLLPRLVDAGLVCRTDEGVTLGDHPALSDPRVDSVVARADRSLSDDQFDLVGRPRRCTILSVLATRDGPVSVETLARDLHARRNGHDRPDDGETDPIIDRLRASLHHADLPALEAAGFVAYDAESNRVEPGTDSGFDRLEDRAGAAARHLVESP